MHPKPPAKQARRMEMSIKALAFAYEEIEIPTLEKGRNPAQKEDYRPKKQFQHTPRFFTNALCYALRRLHNVRHRSQTQRKRGEGLPISSEQEKRKSWRRLLISAEQRRNKTTRTTQ